MVETLIKSAKVTEMIPLQISLPQSFIRAWILVVDLVKISESALVIELSVWRVDFNPKAASLSEKID